MKKLNELMSFDLDVHPNSFGLELEIENFQLAGKMPKNWAMKEDGSLRNNGREFVSDPLRFEHVEACLTQMLSVLKLNEDSYSERTSIHVHCNVRDFTSDNIASMALLYLVFEGIFFSYVDKTRQRNIFCVALTEFQAAEYLSSCFYKPDFQNGLPWEKYSAFNLLPLTSLGTIEFRHMQGNNDIPYIMTWIEAINHLKTLASQHSFDEWFAQISVLNNTSEYFAFVKRCFGNVAEGMFRKLTYSDYKRLMYPGIVQAKLWTVLNQQKLDAEVKSKAKKAKQTIVFDELVNNVLPGELWPAAEQLNRRMMRVPEGVQPAPPPARVPNQLLGQLAAVEQRLANAERQAVDHQRPAPRFPAPRQARFLEPDDDGFAAAAARGEL